jgi:hypothetical protein
VEPIQPIARDDADDVGEAPLAAATAFLHRDDARASVPALRLPERVLDRGPVHARPGRDGVDVQRAAPVHPAFVADDAHHRDLAPCESSGQGRRQRAGCDEAAAPFDRGLLVGRSLSPASPASWDVSRAAGWTGRRPTLLEGLPARPCSLVEDLRLVFVEPAVGEVTEETIVDQIEAAAENTSFVIVDLEGTASLMVSYAISMSDFVVIPVQGSQLDAKQAARQMKLIKAQERIANRPIPFAVLFTRTNPAILPRTQRFIEERFAELKVPIFATKLYDREAFRAIFSYGGSVAGLKEKVRQ